MHTNGFVRHVSREIPYYSCLAFESLPWVRHGFSTRHGGTKGAFNLKESSVEHAEEVRDNQRRFLSALGLDSASLITMHQTHSTEVHRVDGPVVNPGRRLEGDALITQSRSVALAVKTADCLPVLIADPVHQAAGAVHSGWRGTLSGILLKTIQAMQKAFGSDPSELRIAIGPGIRACCFETGQEVLELFEEAYPNHVLGRAIPGWPGKHYIDLCKVLHIQLDIAGVRFDQRHDSALCTCCRTQEFFSYRAEGAASGRMMAVIGIS